LCRTCSSTRGVPRRVVARRVSTSACASTTAPSTAAPRCVSLSRTGRTPPWPGAVASDCTNSVNLEFAVESSEQRANALHKIEMLLGALTHFRDGLIAEAALYAERERHT